MYRVINRDLDNQVPQLFDREEAEATAERLGDGWEAVKVETDYGAMNRPPVCFHAAGQGLCDALWMQLRYWRDRCQA